jgi:[protein-PII] uridylyltransferase
MQNEVGRLRREFREGRNRLFPPEARVAPPLGLIEKHVDFVDTLIREIYEISCSFAERTARRSETSALSIVATGGYGRRELNPCSDIDIAFVPSEEEDPWVEAVVHMAFKLVMDVFLSFREVRVGYSYRPISEVSTWELATRTALLDSRHLCGDTRLSAALSSAVGPALSPLDLLLEQQRRKNKDRQEASLYAIEPHLKFGAGSLRDLHRARWLYKLLEPSGDQDTLNVIAKRKLLPAAAISEIRQAAEWFWRARNWLHLFTGKRSDVLLIDYQDRIAAELGNCSAQKWLDTHFAHAEVLAHFREAAIRCTLEGPLDLGGVRLENGALHADENLQHAVKLIHFSQHYGIPVSLYDSSELASRRAESLGVRTINSEEAWAFLGILGESRGVAQALGILSNSGLLDRFIPGFSRLLRFVPPDASHTYTVGKHSLRIVEHLENLRSGIDLGEQHFRDLAGQCQHYDLLYLAALLHDAGKIDNPVDHSESVMPLTEAVAETLNLSREKWEILTVLVRHHLLLVRTARLHDLKSPAIIQTVADKCLNLDALRHLYLFTFVDTRAVSEKSWTSLDYRDLEELYRKVQDVLSGKAQETSEGDAVEHRIGQIRRKLASANGPHSEQEVLRHCDAMPASYVLNSSLDEIAVHIQLIERLRHEKVVLDFYNRPGDDYSELTICTHDDPRPGLLAKITGVLFGCNADIQRAQVYTLANEEPVVLDTLWIRSGGLQVTENRAARIRKKLSEVLTGAQSVDQFLGAAGKQAPERLHLESLELRNDLSEEHTVVHLIAHDSHGLLYAMTRALSRCGLHIHTAKVATWNTLAENNFYVTDLSGHQLKPQDLAAWKLNLSRQLSGSISG